jgi:hypothetical protein
MSELLLDRAGRRRSPATMPGFHTGRPPRNKGLRYPADPPTVEEIVAVMRAAGDRTHGRRLRGLIVILWRAGLRIQEVLALAEADLDHRRGALLVRRGKGGRRREVGMDAWGWDELKPWLATRIELPVGPLFCVINGPTRGRHWSSAGARADLRRTAVAAGVRRRFAPHQLRHAHAVEMAREGVPLIVIQRQLGHSNLGITSVYLQGIDNAEIIETVHARRAPMIPSADPSASKAQNGLPPLTRHGAPPRRRPLRIRARETRARIASHTCGNARTAHRIPSRRSRSRAAVLARSPRGRPLATAACGRIGVAGRHRQPTPGSPRPWTRTRRYRFPSVLHRRGLTQNARPRPRTRRLDHPPRRPVGRLPGLRGQPVRTGRRVRNRGIAKTIAARAKR